MRGGGEDKCMTLYLRKKSVTRCEFNLRGLG